MSNRMYLVCTHHAEQQDALLMGSRGVDGYEHPPSQSSINKWFEQHKHCGNSHDHFTIAFEHAKNHDMVSVDAGVARALRSVQ